MKFAPRAVNILKRLVAELNANSFNFKEQIQKVENLSTWIRVTNEENPAYDSYMRLLRNASNPNKEEWNDALSAWENGNLTGAVDLFLKAME